MTQLPPPRQVASLTWMYASRRSAHQERRLPAILGNAEAQMIMNLCE